MSQYNNWRDGGGHADLVSVTKALRGSGRALKASAAADSPSSYAHLATAAAALEAAAQTAQADPPPACVPGLRTDESTAMANIAQAAQGEQDAAQAAENGDIQTATSDINATFGPLATGDRAMNAATTDITSFTGG
jgi:hypothetical protein